MTREPRPDFLLVGAPKAGTSALHLALAAHPDVFVTTPKEPKFWLCENAPPPHWSGPGDRHSQREWVWHPDRYADLFRPAPDDAVRGESTPFYLWHRGAQHRIADALPGVRIVAVVRDPIDRAYSNWMHLWSDGLEPEADFETAFGRQDERIAAGYAPFWRYRDLGLYGEQLRDLYKLVDPARVLVVRYRDIVDHPAATVDRTCRFLGIREGQVSAIPRDNSRPYVAPGWRPRFLGPLVRGGAWAGQFAPPQAWRRASVPLVSRLQARDAHRPSLTPAQRERLLPAFADDIRLLGELTGEDFSDWLSTRDRGSFAQRTSVTRSWAPSDRAAST
ncbi:sulfotransferase family protein [Pimelobacter simplex]|uniref:Sulfotransferase n=2 Tax=Nocardioides simplex TaxID=2045 RepID=A0A0C5XBQ4_NOCSI|nr:sulfotransferase [Pimelobacter simplex]AJR18730.1 Sulfotransferase [Pimelobacter simplex]GEB14767.1 sulfotransferase [Pimelobacter simplex]SFM25612.1 Sulfotransferase family protein [Pimelobacter simplex]